MKGRCYLRHRLFSWGVPKSILQKTKFSASSGEKGLFFDQYCPLKSCTVNNWTPSYLECACVYCICIPLKRLSISSHSLPEPLCVGTFKPGTQTNPVFKILNLEKFCTVNNVHNSNIIISGLSLE